MPRVDIDSEADGVKTDDAEAKVVATSMEGGTNTWYLEPGESIEISDDAPNAITVQTL